MQENKITMNLSTVIIIAIIIGALITGIGFLLYNNFNKDTEKMVDDEFEQIDNYSQDTETDDIDTNTNTKENSSSTNNENTPSTSTSISTPTSVTGKASSKNNPLSVGEWGIASKRFSGEYVDVPIKITKITRGNNAAKEVKSYCDNGSSIYRYEDAKEGMEWAVIEYNVDLTKFDKETFKDVNTKITGTGDNTSIKYNGYTYIVSCKFATTLPIGCTDYLVVLGTADETQAFFKGK